MKFFIYRKIEKFYDYHVKIYKQGPARQILYVYSQIGSQILWMCVPICVYIRICVCIHDM